MEFSEIDHNCYTNEDIDYMIGMIKNNIKDFNRGNTLKLCFEKTLNSIHKLCGELGLERLEERIYMHYADVILVDHFDIEKP